MAAVGGDILEVSYNHQTIGSGRFFPKSGEDSTFDLGGARGNDDENGLDGGGRTIRQLNIICWGFEGVVSWDANISDELSQLSRLAGDPIEADWTITSINGVVWGAKGAPVGAIKGNGNAATLTLKISGGGLMKQIK